MRLWISPSHMNYFATVLKKEWLRVYGKTTVMNPWYVLGVVWGWVPHLLQRASTHPNAWSQRLFIPEQAYCWDRFYFPILTGDTQLGGSPYLCLLKPRAWSHQQEDTFVVPSQGLCVLIQMGRRDCPYAGKGVPPLPRRCLWEFSPWGSWSLGREGGANRQTALG